MKMKFSVLLLFSSVCFFVGCASTGALGDYYKPFIPDEVLDNCSEECILESEQEPKVYYSSKLNDDIDLLKSNYYMILGWSSYNGPSEDDIEEYTINFCKEKRALIGLYSYKYTDTRQGIYSVGNYIGSYDIKRYDYDIVLFISMSKDYIQNQKTGFEIQSLDTSSRKRLQRNTGVVIDVVYSESNAFYANIIKDDVIIKINDTNIIDKDDYFSVYENLQKGQVVNLIIVRNGIERTISYKL